MTMLCTTELDMADTVVPSDISDFLMDAAWAICSTYHTVLKASPGAAIFGRDMLFDIPFLADWNRIGDYRQHQTDRNTQCENKSCMDWDIKLVIKYYFTKKVSSANQKVGTIVIPGLYQQSIRMEQSGFNVEQNQNN